MRDLSGLSGTVVVDSGRRLSTPPSRQGCDEDRVVSDQTEQCGRCYLRHIKRTVCDETKPLDHHRLGLA